MFYAEAIDGSLNALRFEEFCQHMCRYLMEDGVLNAAVVMGSAAYHKSPEVSNVPNV